ncbi:MAG: glycosyltransferase family 2 protein [Paludibacter sp.]
MDKPRFSIITVNLNDRIGLENTIQSVINQTYQNFEFIIIDGASIDGSIEIIKQYSDRITYWVSEKDKGIYNAMNKGIVKAFGEYCFFLNSRDVLHDDNVLQKIADAHITEDIVFGDIIKTYDQKNDYVKYERKISLYYLSYTTIWHQASLIKTELFNNLGLYNENFKIASDWDFWLKSIIVNKCSYKYLAFPFSIFDTTGVGSDKKYIHISMNEKKEIFLFYFSSLQYYFFQYLRRFEKSLFCRILRKVFRVLNNKRKNL